MIKSVLRKVIPHSVIERYWAYIKKRRIRGKSCEEVFTEIYEKNRWGGFSGQFCSGPGSSDESIVSEYVSVIGKLAALEGFLGLRFVDLGCGDFQIGKRLLPYCSSYTGVDVVKPLIARNQGQFGTSSTKFMHLDIVREELPQGDVCFIRQVFQHLSNKEILAILPKLKKYRWVLITEHHPEDNGAIKPNLDKAHGNDVRVNRNSGIFLSKPPFKLSENSLKVVLEIPGTVTQEGCPPGVIRTYLYKPGI